MKKFISTTSQPGEFLVPSYSDGVWSFNGRKTQKSYTEEMIVFVGKNISAKDVFAKMADNGHAVSSVNSLLEYLEVLIADIPNFKIGAKFSLHEGRLHAVQS